MPEKRYTVILIALALTGSLLFGGCANLNPTTPPPPSAAPPSLDKSAQQQDYTVTYNYGDIGPVQLSANNLVLATGQKLILQPAPGLTKDTHFSSAGESFFGRIMKQEGDPQANGKVVFTAKAPGKGKLTIIPNVNETARAVDLWVTVQ